MQQTEHNSIHVHIGIMNTVKMFVVLLGFVATSKYCKEYFQREIEYKIWLMSTLRKGHTVEKLSCSFHH